LLPPLVRAAALPALYFGVQLIPHPASIQPSAWRLLGIFVAAIAGLILQPISGGALVLGAVVLASLIGGLSIQQALAGYADTTVWLVMCAYFISDALIRTGLARRIALVFVRAVGRTSIGVCYALSLTDMALATVIPSNGARSGGVVLPIARSIAELYQSRPGASAGLLGTFLMLAVYQATGVTAAMFFTGQASNPVAAQIAGDHFHYPVTLLGWAAAGIVPGLCSLAAIPLVVYRLERPGIERTPEARAFAEAELHKMGPMSRQERIAAVVFAGVCGMWVTTSLHRVDITTTALAGVAALLYTGVLSWPEVVRNHSAWDLFLWYGGLVRLGKALGEAGLTRAFADGVAGSLGGVAPWALVAITLLVYFYAHYGFASITSHLFAMFLPFVAALVAKGAPVGLAVYSLACFTSLSCGLTHYGTTPSPMFFSAGYVSFRTWWRVGFLVSLVNLAIWSTVGFGWWKLIGIW
jgi:DASS family divalent anion:Na+ symporter